MSQPRFVPDDPTINAESAPYWQAASEGRLAIMFCRACDSHYHYPREHCPHCLSKDTEWHTAKGTGSIYSFSIMRRTQTPYVVAFVRLDEGVTMIANIVETPFDAIAIDSPVALTFVDSASGHPVPVFRQVDATGPG